MVIWKPYVTHHILCTFEVEIEWRATQGRKKYRDLVDWTWRDPTWQRDPIPQHAETSARTCPSYSQLSPTFLCTAMYSAESLRLMRSSKHRLTTIPFCSHSSHDTCCLGNSTRVSWCLFQSTRWQLKRTLVQEIFTSSNDHVSAYLWRKKRNKESGSFKKKMLNKFAKNIAIYFFFQSRDRENFMS